MGQNGLEAAAVDLGFGTDTRLAAIRMTSAGSAGGDEGFPLWDVI